MNCPVCGEISEDGCLCHSASDPPVSHESEPEACSDSSAPSAVSSDDSAAWRDELANRLNRYRARRKMRPPRYPSLALHFEPVPASTGGNSSTTISAAQFQVERPIANSSLALDQSPFVLPAEISKAALTDPSADKVASHDGNSDAVSAQPKAVSVAASQARSAQAKIIEFPRFAWAPPSPPPDELAEPVMDKPRILEVPESPALPPALGGITIEPAVSQEIEKRPGIDFPLQSASVSRRVLASLVDGSIIALASTLFGLVFWKVAGVRPPLLQTLVAAAVIVCLFWGIYQYLLIVHSARTPGLLVAGLELTRFDGRPATRSLRRWRILASFLSAASVGMGYAWVFLDEDALCWHDRITHTYLAPKKGELASGQ